MRIVVVLHRYLAVTIGLLMTLWCVSGFVMMYQSYPELTTTERLQGLEPLDLTSCCQTGALNLAIAGPSPGFRIEMLNGDPVLRLESVSRRSGVRSGVWNLRTGVRADELSSREVREVASLYGQRHGIAGEPRELAPMQIDQWTVQTARRNQPVHHFAFNDPAATEIYVSGASGEVFQDTNRSERLLAWFGAIPHWLYPLELRRNAALWLQIVIWTSVIGTFLTATGLYVGIVRWTQARKRGRVSTFRGWWFWHHITGLVFGVLTLVWVFTGLLTVNPWGALSGGTPNYGSKIRGTASSSEIQRFLGAIAGKLDNGEFVQLQSAPFDDRLYVVATRADGSRLRLDAAAQPAPLETAAVEDALAKRQLPVRELVVMTKEDSFYYGQETAVELPAYRVILDDDEQTRLYISPTSGSVRVVGTERRISRWIRTGLHDFDFAWMRARPIWDLIVLPLLAGVTLVCASGTWLAWKRIRLDLRRLRRKFRRQAATAPHTLSEGT